MGEMGVWSYPPSGPGIGKSKVTILLKPYLQTDDDKKKMMTAYRDVPCENMKVEQHAVVVKRDKIIQTVLWFGNKFCNEWKFEDYMKTLDSWT